MLLLTGCAPGLQEERAERYFWPPDPEYAKVEFIDFYVAKEDVAMSGPTLLDEFLGQALPQPLFAYPYGVATNQAGKVFVSDTRNKVVVVFDFALGAVSYLQSEDGGRYNFPLPMGVAAQPGGKIFVVEAKNHQVLVFSSAGKYETSFGADDLTKPTGLAYCEKSQRLFVVDTGQHRVVVFDKDYRKTSTIGERGAQPGQFNYPLDAAVGPSGNLFVLDTLNAKVQVFSPAGEFLHQFGERGTAAGSFALPKSITVSAQGHVYVTDSVSHKFMIFDQYGQLLLAVGGHSRSTSGRFSPGGFYSPIGITADLSGAIFVVDAMNRGVHKFQYLTPEYLAAHPILPGQSHFPLQMSGVDQ